MSTLRPNVGAVSSFVYAAVRTPFARFNGALAGIRADDLGAAVVASLLSRTPALDPAEIGDIIWGNANGAGEDNRNVGRMAALLAGVPVSVPATTVNRLCGSSLDAVMIGSRIIETGDADILLTGGVESMTRAPWVLPKPDRAFPVADVVAVSTALGWRLVNPRMPKEWTVSLGEANEQLQEKFGISRERQDVFAARSHQLAHQAWANGFYDDLVIPVDGGDLVRDEGIRADSSPESLSGLKPVFRKDGTITAGNASPLSDGASAVLLGAESAAERIGAAPLARVAGRGAYALEPQAFGYAPSRRPTPRSSGPASNGPTSVRSSSTRPSPFSRLRASTPGRSTPRSSTSGVARSRLAIRSARRAAG